MKAITIVLLVLFTNLTFAYEELVFDGNQRDFSRGSGHFTSSFYVINESGEAGVKVTFNRDRDDFIDTYDKFFPMKNMFMEGNKLMINLDGEMIECGTMGESRIFKIPTLYLSGNCSTRIETKRTGTFFNPKTFLKVFLNVNTSK